MKFNIDVSAHEILELIRPYLPPNLSISSITMRGDTVWIDGNVSKIGFRASFELKRTDNGKSLTLKLGPVKVLWMEGLPTKLAKDRLSKVFSNLKIPGVDYSQDETRLKVTFAELQIPKCIAFIASGRLSSFTLDNGISLCFDVSSVGMEKNAWYDKAVFYHIYPFGELKDRSAVMRLDDMRRTLVPYLHGMGFTAVCLGPVWKSSSHGYKTIDYLEVDERLGTNAHLYSFVKACHDCGIKVVLDAVFNHVGPEFPGYVVCNWIDWFHIDGLRLDVADGLPIGFLQGLRRVTSEKKKEFYLVGELTAQGVDYRERCGEGRCDGALNYRAMGALIESLRGQTLQPYASCLDYEFGSDGRYGNLALYNFIENHDRDRAASLLSKLDLHLAYALMFVSPGVPSVFYGGEWGATGRNQDRSALRVYSCADLASGNIPNADEKSIAEDIKRLIKCCAENPELRSSFFKELEIDDEGDFCPGKDIMAFRRSENLLCVASRMDKTCDCVIHGCLDGKYKDVLNTDTAEITALAGSLSVKAFPGWVRVLRKIA